MKHLGLKCFSLIIAILLWYFVTTNITSVTLKVPVEISNIPSDRIVLSSFDNQASVKLSGPAFLVSSVSNRLPIFKKRLPESVENRFVLTLRPGDLDLPAAIEVQTIEPSQIELTFDHRLSKIVRVEIPRIGTIEKGLTLESIDVFPKSLTITGPGSELKDISQVETFPVDLREIRGSSKKIIPIRRPGKLTTLPKDQVEISIQVSFSKANRTFAGVPVELRSLNGEKVHFDPSTVTVEISGPEMIVNRIAKENIVPFARLPQSKFQSLPDMNSAKPTPESSQEEKMKVFVDLPPEVSVVGVYPPVVTVRRTSSEPIREKPEILSLRKAPKAGGNRSR